MKLFLPEYFLADVAATVGFGLIAILLLVFGYKVFDKLTPKLPFDDSVRNGNVAAGIVVASFMLGLSYVIAHVVVAILGGGA